MQANQQHINYGFEDIEKYFQGKMSAAEMHALEKAALQDAFLADAVEGYKNSSLQQSKRDLEEIKNKILNRKEETKIVPLISLKKWMWAAAAVGIILIGSLFWLNNNPANFNNQPVAKNMPSSNQQQDSVTVVPHQQSIDTATKIVANIFEKKKKNRQKNSVDITGNQSTVMNDERNVPMFDKLLPDSINQLQETYAAKANKKTGLTAGETVQSQIINPAVTANYSGELAGNVAGVSVTNNAANKSINAHKKQKADSNSNQYNNIAGRIIDNKGNPVPYASIVYGNKIGTQTDNNGYFSINAKDSILNSTVAAIGYNSAIKKLYKGQSNNIVLHESVAALDEVVVVGYGTKKRRDVTGNAAVINNDNKKTIVPEGGWDSLKTYLTNKLENELALQNLNIYGVYSFKLELDENNRPQKIKITSSPNKKINLYFIKALQDGTKWHSQKTSSNKKYKTSIKL